MAPWGKPKPDAMRAIDFNVSRTPFRDTDGVNDFSVGILNLTQEEAGILRAAVDQLKRARSERAIRRCERGHAIAPTALWCGNVECEADQRTCNRGHPLRVGSTWCRECADGAPVVPFRAPPGSDLAKAQDGIALAMQSNDGWTREELIARFSMNAVDSVLGATGVTDKIGSTGSTGTSPYDLSRAEWDNYNSETAQTKSKIDATPERNRFTELDLDEVQDDD